MVHTNAPKAGRSRVGKCVQNRENSVYVAKTACACKTRDESGDADVPTLQAEVHSRKKLSCGVPVPQRAIHRRFEAEGRLGDTARQRGDGAVLVVLRSWRLGERRLRDGMACRLRGLGLDVGGVEGRIELLCKRDRQG